MSIATIKIAAIASLAIGSGLTIFSFFIPGIENSRLETQAEDYALTTSENKNRWTTIPGEYNQMITWSHYLYPVANWDRVSKMKIISFRYFTTTSLLSSTRLGLMIMHRLVCTIAQTSPKLIQLVEPTTSIQSSQLATHQSTHQCGSRTKQPWEPGGEPRIRRCGRPTSRSCTRWLTNGKARGFNNLTSSRSCGINISPPRPASIRIF